MHGMANKDTAEYPHQGARNAKQAEEQEPRTPPDPRRCAWDPTLQGIAGLDRETCRRMDSQTQFRDTGVRNAEPLR